MQPLVIEHYSGFPQKLVDLKWLEEELHDVSLDDVDLNWNRMKKCVEHRFSDEWEVEYSVLQHWADHVGAKFEITEDADPRGYFSAFIYR